MSSDIPVLPLSNRLVVWCGHISNTSHEGDATVIPWLIICANAPSSCMSDNEYEEGITGQNMRNVVLNLEHCRHYCSIAEIPYEREKC